MEQQELQQEEVQQEEVSVVEGSQQDVNADGETPPHHDRDEWSKALIGKMKTNVKIIKWLVIAAGILAGILLLYGILLVTVFDSSNGAFIGFIVLLVVEGLMFLAFGAMLIYTKIILNKLKKHK